MKGEDVVIGGLYYAKVSGKRVTVRIDAENLYRKGWQATNTVTGRKVEVKTGARLTSIMRARPL